jgi:hypothetical protein
MNAPTDLAALKTRQRGAWASGDYAVTGTELLDPFNRAGPASLVVPSEYLEVVATRR